MVSGCNQFIPQRELSWRAFREFSLFICHGGCAQTILNTELLMIV